MFRKSKTRRGVTAVIAMLYLALFATLALGFYASVTTAVQVAGNEQRGNRAALAAESGMAFIKFHLANLNVPPQTPTDEVFEEVYQSLGNRLDGYPNMGGQEVWINPSRDLITIPGPDDTWIDSDSDGSRFRVVIQKQHNGQQLRVKVIGKHGTTVHNGRAVQLDYAIAKNAARVFNFGVASKSAISMNGNVSIRGTTGHASMGSVLSATTSTDVPLVMTGNASISGDVSFVNPNANPSIGSNSTIAGKKPGDPGFWDHVHKNVPEVPFPEIDTSVFEPYAVNTYDPSMGSTLTNVRLPPGNYTFNNATVTGVLYIEQPSTIKFGGQSTIHGVIVADNQKVGTHESNKIEFKSVDAIPINEGSNPDIPQGLKELTGSFLLAENFTADFGGNFNTVSGSIIASKISFSGTAGGTVKGSVINLEDTAVTLGGTTDIIIESQGTANYPAGVFFGSHFAPLPYTYMEVEP